MKTSKLVEKVLGYSIPARNSDTELIIRILEEMGADLTQRQIDIIREVSFESIRRVRQKLQEQDKYLPSPEVAKQRRLKGYIIQQNEPQSSPERLGKLVEEQPWNPANARPGYLQEQLEAQPKAISWEKD